jgi:hypothetical protein
LPFQRSRLKAFAVPDLSINIAGLKLANPLLTCSGTCGYAHEYADFMDLSQLGAFVTKSITREERPGNEPTRIVETRAGMLNAIGLANVGLDRFLTEKIPLIQKMPCPVIVNVAGHSFDDYTETCAAMDNLDCIAAVELNVSCPNVKDGLTFGTHPGRLKEFTREVKKVLPHKPLIVKLSPNVEDVTLTARAAIEGGCPNDLDDQHLHRHGDRHLQKTPTPRQRHRRPLRPRHQTHRPAPDQPRLSHRRQKRRRPDHRHGGRPVLDRRRRISPRRVAAPSASAPPSLSIPPLPIKLPRD